MWRSAISGEHGPTPSEVDETRGYLVGSIPRLLETNDSIAGFLQTANSSVWGSTTIVVCPA